MPGTKQRDFDDYIRTRWAEGARATVIERELKEQARPGIAPPSLKTIRRRFDDFGKVPDETREEWRRLDWPGTMLAGVLPWEASRAVLDFVRWRQQHDPPRDRPTVRVAKWVWRLRLASPSIPFEAAEHIAETLTANDFARDAGLHADAAIPDLLNRLANQGPWTDLVWRGTLDPKVLDELNRQRFDRETADKLTGVLAEQRAAVERFDRERHTDE